MLWVFLTELWRWGVLFPFFLLPEEPTFSFSSLQGFDIPEIWQKILNHPGKFTLIWGENNPNMKMLLLQLRHLFAKVWRNWRGVKRILMGDGFIHAIPRLADINHLPDFVFLAYFVKVTELWITRKSIASKPVL